MSIALWVLMITALYIGYGKSNAREIIIDKLLGKETYDKILDLSHYKQLLSSF